MLAKKDIPNALTVLRLILSAVFFVVLLFFQYHAGAATNAWVLPVATALFIVAALTDALDGYLARKWQVISVFGRIVDPLADKVLVIGAFIMLAGANFADPAKIQSGAWFAMVSGVYPWMVVVILVRELMVTTIRATLEGQGIDFSAKQLGKWKMILQSIVVPIVLIIVWIDPSREGLAWLGWVRDVLVWLTVAVTILSGLPYVTGAIKALQPKPDA